MTSSKVKKNLKAETKRELSLTIQDVTCPVCLSIMIKPVSMPCTHALCFTCFELNVSESNLSCPLCRKRISIWVRKMRKQKSLIDEVFWADIQRAFPEEIENQANGEELHNNNFIANLPPRKVSPPGEIKADFEAELRRVEEEEKERKKTEEELAEKVLLEIQAEEREQLENVSEERQRLTEQDFEFAKRVRSSQLKETLSKVSWITKKTGQKNGKQRVSQKSSLHHFMGAGFSKSPSRPNSLLSSPCSPLRDITSQRSSESESDFDSEENIVKMEKEKENVIIRKKERDFKENKTWLRKEQDSEQSSASDPIEGPSTQAVGDENTLETRLNEISALIAMLKQNEQQDQETLNFLYDEKRLISDRISQEAQDRNFALKLQKTMKQVNRAKGSEDEYFLRTAPYSPESSPRRASPSHRQSPSGKKFSKLSTSSPRSSQGKRQATLIECITKRQRRL